jgi:hypothetical protein
MTEFNISRIRYNWRGAWTTGIEYKIDDVIQRGGSSFVCIVKHTASALFASDLENVDVVNNVPAPKWIKMTDGFAWRDQWEIGAVYDKGDLTLYGGVVYLCIEAHVADQLFSDNEEKWTIYSSQIAFRQDWEELTRYGVNDVVRYGGIVYRCIEEHTAADTVSGLEADQNKWTVYYLGVDYKSDWTIGTQYKEGDLVKFGGSLYRAKEKSIPVDDSSINFDKDAWELVAPGYQFRGEWNSETAYRIGDVVRHGGWLFYSLSDNFNDNPATSIYQIENRTDPVSWEIITKGINFRGDWEINRSYKTGDLVRRGGNVYVALLDTEITADGSSLDYLDSSNWELVSEGQNYRAEWTVGREYSIGDIAEFYGTAYICKLGHLSNNTNFPSLDIASAGTGFQFWEVLVEAGFPGGLRFRGDLLTFNLLRDFYGDDSSFGPINITAGIDGQLVSVNNDQSVIYKSYGIVERVFYVALDGVDDITDPERGVSQFKPWRTVKFACEQADDGFEGTTTVRVRTGKYDEILPIIVPKKTAIVGDELRSTNIRAASSSLSINDRPIFLSGLNRISQLIQAIIAGEPLTVPKTPTNPLNPVIVTETITSSETDLFGNIIEVEEEIKLITSLQASLDIQQLILDIRNYINFNLISSGSEPSIIGTNEETNNLNYANSVRVLQANKEFIAREVIEFTKQQFPSYVFNEESRRNDIHRLVNAWSYDLIFTGNYKSLLEARYYRNQVVGSKMEDMFYFRDSTGLRNLTVSGLEGNLTPLEIRPVDRRPTGGAYASLDPGWGPDDDRTWIINRSPYVQNVTTLGRGAIGQKIDGALHNGGNRSIVSNDFTQVIDEGIGAWVLNSGRAELVSVFSYYSHIGYLTENGGIIRSTNGNNSYGSFGCVATGNDDTETPIQGTVNNRNQQASARVFAGDFTDEIQIIEWQNAGQNYTQANATFIGAGVGANVLFEDFRDDAVHSVEITDSSETDLQRIGGGGYINIQNNAQLSDTPGADLTSIRIAANDPNTEAEYLGCRILLTSGPGTGQYGYITGYNTLTRVVTVARESDDQLGWDHVVPGTPPAQTLTGSTVYRIEPRPIFSEPQYQSEEYLVSLSTNWGAVAYGETIETYSNIEVDLGTGNVIEDDGLIPVPAIFNVIKTGRSYSITISDSGAGYKVGDEFIITGDQLGGVTPFNDLLIKVTETSEDSTNSIIDFEFEGIGSSGRFVAITEQGSAGAASKDGVSWSEQFNMPSAGDWTVLGTGNNRFVAIQTNSNQAATSLDGINWTARTMPVIRQWKSIVYGDDKFVAIASDQSGAVYSVNNGVNWIETELPTIGDSSFPEWVDIAYGKNRFVVVANSQNIAGYSDDGITWTGIDLYNDSSAVPNDWVGVAYGNNRFVTISSNGQVLYSFNGETWLSAEMPVISPDIKWSKLKYAQGVFFTSTIRDDGNATNIIATSFDGIVWQVRVLSSNSVWKDFAFGNPYIDQFDSTVGKNTPFWVIISNTNVSNRIRTGARTIGRAEVTAGVISRVRLWDTGSGYQNKPLLTLISPTATSQATFQCRTADGVLTNPTWLNRGLGYRTATTRTTITGNGFADVLAVGRFVTLENLSKIPGTGSQVFFAGNSRRYNIVTIQPINNLLNGNTGAIVRVNPELRIRDELQHGTAVTIRERYSQIRVTGHDFLDIGTGNFAATNYPELYSGPFFSAPEDEVVELDGGRVFYTSTDQSGNFRTGELFAVEQATGIVTLSADFFDLSGLTELRLGGIRVGGTGAVIREFSTDPTLSEDSNNVVPTQRAIAAFLQSRLTLGGSEIATFAITAGQIGLGGPDIITNNAGLKIVIPVMAEFSGPNAGISGSMLAQNMFFRSFNE